MGICASCDVSPAAAPATAPATAKLILQDGGIREFPRPVKVSHALGEEKGDPAWFVCDADGMEFDGFVSAVPADGELRPGQIYFVLPQHMLRHPLHAEDLAALAVKASSALMRAVRRESSSFRKGSVAPQPLVFAEAGEAAVLPPPRRAWRRSGGRGRNFELSLSAIPE